MKKYANSGERRFDFHTSIDGLDLQPLAFIAGWVVARDPTLLHPLERKFTTVIRKEALGRSRLVETAPKPVDVSWTWPPSCAWLCLFWHQRPVGYTPVLSEARRKRLSSLSSSFGAGHPDIYPV